MWLNDFKENFTFDNNYKETELIKLKHLEKKHAEAYLGRSQTFVFSPKLFSQNYHKCFTGSLIPCLHGL